LSHVDTVVAFDCIYNLFLLPHFVSACLHIGEIYNNPVFLLGMEIRSEDILTEFLVTMNKYFQLGRVSEKVVPESMAKGYVLYIAKKRSS